MTSRAHHIPAFDVVRDEVRRSLGMPVALVRERNLDRTLRDAIGDDVEATADMVAKAAVENGFARELLKAVEARLAAAPRP